MLSKIAGKKERENPMLLILSFILVLLLSFSLFVMSVSAQTYRDLEGDEISISTLEEGEYLVEVRGNARFISEELEITGEEADLNTMQQELEFRGDVVAEAPDFFVSAQNLLYFLDTEKAEFTGEAYVEFQDFTARAEMVEYFMAEERALLTGQVEGTRAGDDFSAEEVEIDLAKETVDLRGDARIRIFDEEGELLNEDNTDD